jgi:glutamate racemase
VGILFTAYYYQLIFVEIKMRSIHMILALIFILFFGKTGYASGDDQDHPIVDRKKITVVITDSGLGGLAVMDDIAKKMAGSGFYKRVNLIFVNALFDADKGYNALPSREEKINVFNSVLYGMENRFHPDIILIGCNTLSVLFEETEFVKESDTPVVGIVKPGVEIITERLLQDDRSIVVITGTETTISEGSHRKALLERGFSDERIITQACPELQSFIEKDPFGEDTEMLISYYVDEALSKLAEEENPIYLSLNCTHFGYSEKLWEKAFTRAGADLSGILNPNNTMGDFLMPDQNKNRFKRTKISWSVYSKVNIKNKSAIYELFKDSSPELAEALMHYVIDTDLF